MRKAGELVSNGRWAIVQMWMDYTKMVASILLQEARPSLVKTALSPSL